MVDFLNLEFFTKIMESSELKSLIIQISIMFFTAIGFDLFQRKLIGKIQKKLENKENNLIVFSSFINTVRFPVTLVIYILAVTVSLGLINYHLDIALITKFKNLRGIFLLLAIGYFLLSFIKEVKKGKLNEIDKNKTTKDKTVIQITANITSVFVFIVIGLMILQEFGLSISGLMAFGGIGGLVVGLSAKEFLADFFGGIILITDKPFKVGDWICSPDRDIEGTVEEIGMRRICIRTFDKRPIYVPNSILSTITIENPSRMTNRRIFETIGIRYEDAEKMSVITRKVKEMLVEHSAIDTTQTLMVNFNSFNSSSLDFFVYTFTKTTDWQTYHGIKHNILLNIHKIIKEEGADIAFPTNVIHLEEDKNKSSFLELMKQEIDQK